MVCLSFQIYLLTEKSMNYYNSAKATAQPQISTTAVTTAGKATNT